MLLNINWSDPTIIGGIIGIIGSILGAIAGAISTILLTWLFSRGEVKINVLESEFNVSEGIINGVELFRRVTENCDRRIEGIEIKFKCLITNGKKDSYTFSNLEFIAFNKKNKFKKSYQLQDTAQSFTRTGLHFYKNAENYILTGHSNKMLELKFREVGNEFYLNHKECKFYIKYIDFKGKDRYKRVFLNLADLKTVVSI